MLFGHVQLFCDPLDYTVHEILQAGILEWVAFPFSRGSSQAWDQTQVSCIAGRGENVPIYSFQKCVLNFSFFFWGV